MDEEQNYSTYPPPDNHYYNGNNQYPSPGQPLLYPVSPPASPAQSRNIFLRFFIGPVRVPIFSYVSATIMLAVLIYEFVRMNQLTGRLIQTNPFSPMIGPSTTVLINMGARFTPCIRDVPTLDSGTLMGNCYRELTDTCTVQELCGFGGFPSGMPDQGFRLFIPIFMHAGIIHFFINMLTHLQLGIDLEQHLGTVRYAVLYLSAGVYGFVLSAMLSSNGTSSVGCSGALFGLIGYMFVDVLINWKILPHPVRDLMKLLLATVICLVLGLLPGLDNFAHVGGFVVGILVGAALAPMRTGASKKLVIATWAVRVVALCGIVILYAVSINALYSSEDPSLICPNCKYLSCLPVNGWCDV
ncbi:rhomboid family-domain-containing protein [Pilobolus umbonatus]|nr:rhomboid family-domain-containing protein [Pilobolus umbonatus]